MKEQFVDLLIDDAEELYVIQHDDHKRLITSWNTIQHQLTENGTSSFWKNQINKWNQEKRI